MSTFSQLALIDPCSPISMMLNKFHDRALMMIILVLTVVGYALVFILRNSFTHRFALEAQRIETIWTIIPGVILLFLAIPSLHLLYLMDELKSPMFTLKVIGHQWYWSYEYSDFHSNLAFDSYMLNEEDLPKGGYRLLEVDNRAVLPYKTELRLLITSTDVIHAWTIPAACVKADAIPGRLNQLGLSFSRPGVYYGQCSEICGANHSFMPIVVEVVSPMAFVQWAHIPEQST
uniref:Cytochrome c oxidase subunit 2 n=1 Tax=Orbinia latreillii TaxID=195264 RepID=Q1X8Z1_9ANNE|nr:cytochrome c oxidase subunit II [Orbinia latreillii]AAX50140.1 cytochrome c oxidase subunit II [Orbinia latreillii]